MSNHTAAGTPVPTEAARKFALSEDWVATIVGLAIVVLAMLGLITKGMLPL
ncbi:MAG: hypothetical protein LBR33_04250 [Propionibacteriaceae bacterium]|jgi:hypothetical protein|nr:hypothetical protein [Propionibacteriaceae bacterium]